MFRISFRFCCCFQYDCRYNSFLPLSLERRGALLFFHEKPGELRHNDPAGRRASTTADFESSLLDSIKSLIAQIARGFPVSGRRKQDVCFFKLPDLPILLTFMDISQHHKHFTTISLVSVFPREGYKANFITDPPLKMMQSRN